MITPLRIAISLLYICCISTAQAQLRMFDWAAKQSLTFSGIPINQSPQYVIAADPAGGATTCGLSAWTKNYSSFSFGVMKMMHYDAAGAVTWTKQFNGHALPFQMRYDANRNIIMLLHYIDTVRLSSTVLLQAGNTGRNPVLASFDSLGNLNWHIDLTATYGAVNESKAITVDEQGNIYLGYRQGSNGYITKYNAAGTLLSTVIQTAVDLESVDVDEDGNLYVTGSCISNAGAQFAGVLFTPGVTGNGYNRYLARYRANGTADWVKFSGDFSCPNSQVTCHNNNQIYWAGELVGNVMFDTYALNGPANGGTPDYHLARLDSNGIYQWVVEVTTGQNLGAGIGMLNYLTTDSTGCPIICGNTIGTMTWNPYITTTATNRDAMVIKYTPAGAVRWAVTATSSTGGLDLTHGLSLGTGDEIYMLGVVKGTLSLDTITIVPGVTTSYPFVAKLKANPPFLFDGSASGDWNSAANWAGGEIPSASDDVTILSGATLTIDQSLHTCRNLTVESGGTVQFSGSGNALHATGSLYNDGIINTADGILEVDVP